MPPVEVHPEPAPSPGDAPTGHRLLAWDGIGLFVPEDWSVGRHQGDTLYGSIRVDGPDRARAHVRWWRAPRRFRLDSVARQFQRSLARPGKDKDVGRSALQRADRVLVVTPTRRIRLPSRLGDQAQVFLAGLASAPGRQPETITDVVVAAWRRDLQRAVVWRFLVDPEPQPQGPDFEALNRLTAGLLIQGLDQWRDWSVLDMAFQVPPASRLDRAVLAAGVCYFRFDWRGARVGLRRFSAANAVMDRLDPREEDLFRWCGGAYAREFFDMRYRQESHALDADHHLLLLHGRRRLLAPLEIRWAITRHRKPPRRIEIYWDRPANKIVCFEIARYTRSNESAIRKLVESYRALPPGEPPAPGATLGGPRTPRERSLAARVRRAKTVQWELNDDGRAVLRYELVRPVRLRLLRVLAAMPAKHTEQRRVELDLVGSIIWQACDGKTRVRDIVDMVRRQFRITHREAEVSVTEYLKSLGGRGLIALEIPPK